MDSRREIERAERRIRPHVRETPVERCKALESDGGEVAWLKLECLQRTGSFKIRGAMNRVLTLSSEHRRRGIVAASSGNHGAAVACAAAQVGAPTVVVVPETTPTHKVDAIEEHGAVVQRHGRDCVVAERHARALAASAGSTYVSPYNDPAVIAGQGTVGVELCRQLEQIDAVCIALGGGGLAAGVGAYLKARNPAVEIIACSPERSPAMHRSLEAGRIVDVPVGPTLSDATAGGVEPGAITFERCRDLVDRSLLVSESRIADAMRLMLAQHLLIEGAAAVAVAGFLDARASLAGKQVVVLLCGANVGLDVLRAVLAD